MTKFTGDRLLIASGNSGKIREINELLSTFNIDIISAKDFKLEEPEENGASFIENAEIKAKYYGDATGIPALADDSGLCVEALDGKPGIYSARWAGEKKDFYEAMQRVESEIGNNPNKKAKFVCALSIYWPESENIVTVEGKVEGNLVFPARGEDGFGYDPIFIPNGYNKTFAEMPSDIKRDISHRADAFRQLIDKHF